MAKSPASKPIWYAEYDRLFVKSTPIKPEHRMHAVIILIMIGFALLPATYRYGSQLIRQTTVAISRHRLPQTSREVPDVDHFALKAAGLKRTAAINATHNLVATFKDHTVSFSNGYALQVDASLKMNEFDRDHVVTPTTDSGSLDLTIADIEGNANNDYAETDLRLYANLISDFNAYAPKNRPNLVKVFNTATIGTTQTGYVFDVPNPKSDQDYAKLTRYFLFADGTGVVLRTLPDLTVPIKKLTTRSSFAAFKAACGHVFMQLDQNYRLTLPNSN